ncbi:hypothetical protein NDU88_000382 [Pleurodeles waltl]|uniref:Uncharacterized protein n=1 Tax=Pleurodeles waltl TaxID=8319 RepID=A0AAV7V6T6_PLEWA|nr:hypothetical protein NDU88_000382 [Pleurodeles waltl]
MGDIRAGSSWAHNDVAFFHCRQVHQRSVHARIHPSPRKSQRTVPRKDNMEHRVKQVTGQRPSESGHLACHRQGSPDPGGPHQTGHPLPQEVGGHPPRDQEDR